MKKALVVVVVLAVAGLAAVVLSKRGSQDGGDKAAPPAPEAGAPAKAEVAPAESAAAPATQAVEKATASIAKTTPDPAKKPDPRKPDYSQKSRNYVAKLREIDGLGENLPPEQIQSLYVFMDTSAKEQNMDADALCSVKNQALDKLLRQAQLPAGLGDRIVGMATNDKNDTLWRDYCVQHYSAYYDRRWPDGGASDDGERKRFRELYWESVGLAEGKVAGSALLSLERLSEKRAEFPKAEVAEKAWEVASSAKTTPACRVTAIQVAARLGSTNALARARVWAESGDNIALRLSCISSVGQAGDKSDLQILEKLKAAKDPLVKKAAETAAKALQARLASQ